jgi:hypothetical protein
MPRIPDIYTPTVGIQPQGQPVAQAGRVVPFQDPTGQMVAQMGAGVAALGDGLSRIENQIDNARTKEAESLLADFAVEELTKFRSLAGKSAVDGYKPLADGLAKRRQEAEKLLQNDTQRSMFRMAADRRMRSYQQAIQSHYYDQIKVWDGAQNTARMQQFANEALLARDAYFAPEGPDNPYGLAKGGLDRAVRDQAGLLQLPYSDAKDSPYQQYRTKIMGQMHEQVLDAFKDQPAKAKAYLDAAMKNGEILPAAAQKYEADIKDRQVGTEEFEQFRAWRAEGLSPAAMSERLDSMLVAGDVKQEVYDRLEQRINKYEVVEARREQREIRETRQAVVDWWTKMQGSGSAIAGAVGTSPDAMIWEDVPPELRRRAEATGQAEQLRNMVNNGVLFSDTSFGVQTMRGLRSDPSSLVGQDWSAIENALRFELSNDSLSKLATLHGTVNERAQVEKEQQFLRQQAEMRRQREDDAVATREKDTLIKAHLNALFASAVRAAGTDTQEKDRVSHIREVEEGELKEQALGAKSIVEMQAILNAHRSSIVEYTGGGSRIPVPASLDTVQALERGLPSKERLQNAMVPIMQDGEPALVPVRSLGALRKPGSIDPMPVVEGTIGNKPTTLHGLITSFNESNDALRIGTTIQPTYVYAAIGDGNQEHGLVQYLVDKHKLARELLTSKDKRDAWEKQHGFAMFPGGLEAFVRTDPTLQSAIEIRQRAIQSRTAEEQRAAGALSATQQQAISRIPLGF